MARGFVFCMVSWQWQQQQLEQRSVCVSTFSRDAEVTLGSFVVPFGRLFGTKLGGVLVWRRGSSFASFRGSGSSSSWSRRACVVLSFFKDSEKTLESFVVSF